MRRLVFFVSVCALSGCHAEPQRACPLIVPWSLSDQKALNRASKADKDPLIDRALREDAGYREWTRWCQGRS